MISSLRIRLLASALIGVALALSILGFVVMRMFSDYAESDFFDDLEGFEQEVVASVPENGDIKSSGINLLHPQFSKPDSGYYWQAGDGRDILLKSPSMGAYTFSVPDDLTTTDALHHHRLQGPNGVSVMAVEGMVQLPGHNTPLRILVAMDAQRIDASVDFFRTILITSLLVLGAGLVSAASLQVWIGLRPLNDLRARLNRVRDGEAKRLDGQFPAEVAPLVNDLNILLLHQAEVVQRGRVLAGNLAHGLRTPLAVVANETIALERLGQAEKAETIQAQVVRMERMIDYHTARARAAAARDVPGIRCDVTSSVESLRRVFMRLHQGRGLVLSTEIPPGTAFRGDRQDLEEMLGNLVDNAGKWAERNIMIRCGQPSPGWLEVTIDDDGPGLAADLRGEAFARGARLDDTVPGSGLGLAIVKDLAEMYGGTASLGDSPLGGLRAILRLPAIA